MTRFRSFSSKVLGPCALVTALVATATSCSEADTEPHNRQDDGSGNGGHGGGTEQGSDGTGVSCDLGDSAEQCEGTGPTLSCAPELEPTTIECESDGDCAPGSLCFQNDESALGGICERIVGQCVQQCAGDFECASDEFCDPKSGGCVETPPRGDAFGATCVVGEDTCRGRCVELSDGIGECEETCRVGASAGCGEAELATSEVACAYFAFDLSDIDVTQGAGDTGICARLCDCNADCPGDQRCFPDAVGDYRGICTGGLVEQDTLTDCSLGAGGGGSGTP